MERVKVCECCGHPMPSDSVYHDLTSMQGRMFAAIYEAGQAGIRRAELMEILYGDDPNGGPTEENIINVQRKLMTPALEKHGLKIVSTRGHGALWWVIRAEQDAETWVSEHKFPTKRGTSHGKRREESNG